MEILNHIFYPFSPFRRIQEILYNPLDRFPNERQNLLCIFGRFILADELEKMKLLRLTRTVFVSVVHTFWTITMICTRTTITPFWTTIVRTKWVTFGCASIRQRKLFATSSVWPYISIGWYKRRSRGWHRRRWKGGRCFCCGLTPGRFKKLVKKIWNGQVLWR